MQDVLFGTVLSVIKSVLKAKLERMKLCLFVLIQSQRVLSTSFFHLWERIYNRVYHIFQTAPFELQSTW